MTIRLENTDARQINEALFSARKGGQATSGQVLTLVVNTPAEQYEEAMEHAKEAGATHPSRILVAIRGVDKAPGLNAEIRTSASATEVITLEFAGEIDDHAESVLLPLLLPELPVAIWYPTVMPDDLTTCQLRSLSNRQIVDTTRADDPIAAMYRIAAKHQPYATDLAWTRLTPWRALLVAALDQARSPVRSAAVMGPGWSVPSELMRNWLTCRLGIEVTRAPQLNDYHGMQGVDLHTDAGPVTLHRVSPTEGLLTIPGQPDRPVALAHRSISLLLSEELRRLTGDPAFDAVMACVAEHDHSTWQG